MPWSHAPFHYLLNVHSFIHSTNIHSLLTLLPGTKPGTKGR